MNIDSAIKSAFAHYKAGRLDESGNLCKKILKRQPQNFNILNLLGVLYLQQKDYDSAIHYLQKAVSINPSVAEIQNNLGLALINKGQLDEAIPCFKKAVQLNAFHSDAYTNLGLAFFQKGLVEESEKYYRKALQCDPYHVNANLNLGNVVFQKGLVDESIEYYYKAFQHDPNHTDVCNNLATALLMTGQYQESLRFFRKATNLKPDSPLAHFHLSFVLLLLGDFKNGWKEYFWRWGMEEYRIPNWPQPIWDGADFSGKALFIHVEQGFGDMIQVVRYIPLVAQRGGKIILQCQKELLPLIKNVEGVERFITCGDPLPSFDIHCPLLCLPMIFDTNLDTIPANIPYIRADDLLVKKWKEKIGDTSSVKVGVIWRGNPVHKRDRERSIPFEQLAPLAEVGGVSFYSLQKREIFEQLRPPSCGLTLIDFMDEVRDFSDTAALIENLDLVISVDTSVAHLAGAMGKPVWALIQFSPDWRWLLEREDSPWYPTMRLFRQKTRGDWSKVIERIGQELGKLVEIGSSQNTLQTGGEIPSSDMQKDFTEGKVNSSSAGHIMMDTATREGSVAMMPEGSFADRSFVIPVLDYSPHSPYNIRTLLQDLGEIPGEVICIFNSREVYESLYSHPRITKYCFNGLNAGVSRSWNIGINLSEGKTVFVLNADLHVSRNAVEQIEQYLWSLENAVIVGPQGTHIDHRTLSVIRYFEKGTFNEPVKTHDVSGFFFAIHIERFLSHRLLFDVQFSPCFFEEWDMGLQVTQAGLACYAVPVADFDHYWGISQETKDRGINYFGRELRRENILLENRKKFIAKWFPVLFPETS
jgi:tetratricopeptide (TPR) repeat protein